MKVCAAVLLAGGFLTWASPGRGGAGAAETPGLPKVVLVGGSACRAYTPGVAGRLAGKAVVVGPLAEGGGLADLLDHFEERVVGRKPDVVHIDCGPRDPIRARAGGDFDPENLRRFVARVRAETGAVAVIAGATPRAGVDLPGGDDEGLGVARGAGLTYHDLHGLLEADGVLGKPAEIDRLAEAVADCVLRRLVIARYKPLPRPPSGPEAADAYRKAEAARDALVPARYRAVAAPEFPVPEGREDWARRRGKVLDAVVKSLGEQPPLPDPPRSRVICREVHPGYTLERVAIDNGVDGEVSALMLVPGGRKGRVPAILWLHSSTPDKTQVLTPDTNGAAEPLGESFVKAGYAVLAPDSYWHGDRAGTGPAGAAESGQAEQEGLHKLNLWLGRTLWGMFVRDDRAALDYLCRRPEVDPRRVGATGMSMGSTRAWWLAAVDERVAAVAAVACLTRYQNLIRHGSLRRHGVYYYVDGLLKHFDTEGVLALVAPRPLLALTGGLDEGSPADGVRELTRVVGRTYEAVGAGDRFRSVLYPETGHEYTPGMRAEVLAWFDRWLGPGTDAGDPARGGGRNPD